MESLSGKQSAASPNNLGSVKDSGKQSASFAVKSVSAAPLQAGGTGAGAWGASRPASASFSKQAVK